MNGLYQDLRFAARSLCRRPVMTLAAILTLAMGVGANTAIFSVLETALLRPLPYPVADRLVYLTQEDARSGISTTPWPRLVRACRERARSFEQIETYSAGTLDVVMEGEPARVVGARVSPRFFSFLGVPPLLGRAFLPGEGRPGEHRVAVLGHSVWRNRFGADPAVLGRSLQVDDESYRIVGVLPRAFRLDAYSEIEVWLPQVEVPGRDTEDSDPLYAIARLKTGGSVAAAQAELDVISRGIDWGADAGAGLGDVVWTGTVVSPQAALDPRLKTAILVLQVAVGLILLIACANIANLLLAQAETRGRELAIRRALGATRGRIVRQLLTESLVLSLIGGALGLLLSLWSIEAILALLPERLSHLNRLALNPTHLAFGLLVTLASGVAFGLLPALRGSRHDPIGTLKQSAGAGGGPRRGWSSQALMGAEVALALLLLVGAGLLVKSFVRLQGVEPGYAMRDLLTLRLELPERRYPDARRQLAFWDELLGRVGRATLPHVEAVALSSAVVSDIDAVLGKPEIEGSGLGPASRRQIAIAVAATPGYFRVMGIPLLRGRDFVDQDRGNPEPGVIVNEALARRYFPGGDPVGRRLRFTDRWYRILGVVGDVRPPTWASTRMYDLQLYYPSPQRPRPAMNLVVRTSGSTDPKPLIEALRAHIRAIDARVPVTRVATAEQLWTGSMAEQRFNAVLMTLFAVLAAALTSVGVYGVLAHLVSQRAREIGIRVALGAGRVDLLWDIVSRSMVSILAGVTAGLAGALALARILAGLLHDVRAWDPAIFGGASLLVVAIGLVAVWLPSRRSVRAAPMIALRGE